MTRTTGWDNHLLQDMDRGLGTWFCDRLDSRQPRNFMNDENVRALKIAESLISSDYPPRRLAAGHLHRLVTENNALRAAAQEAVDALQACESELWECMRDHVQDIASLEARSKAAAAIETLKGIL